jgi:hypothetical protein
VDVEEGEVFEMTPTLTHSLGSIVFLPDGTLAGVQNSNTTAPVNAHWLEIDMHSGECTEVGLLRDSVETTAFHNSVPDLTLMGDRVLGWSEEIVNGGYDDLIEINTATGVVTKISNDTEPPFTSSTGLASSPDGDVFVLSSGLVGSVWSLNPDTGAATEVGTASHSNYLGNSGEATWHRGELYALNCGSGSTGVCELAVGDSSWTFVDVGITLPVGTSSMTSRVP